MDNYKSEICHQTGALTPNFYLTEEEGEIEIVSEINNGFAPSDELNTGVDKH
jgi:hypothetical protein